MYNKTLCAHELGHGWTMVERMWLDLFFCPTASGILVYVGLSHFAHKK